MRSFPPGKSCLENLNDLAVGRQLRRKTWVKLSQNSYLYFPTLGNLPNPFQVLFSEFIISGATQMNTYTYLAYEVSVI